MDRNTHLIRLALLYANAHLLDAYKNSSEGELQQASRDLRNACRIISDLEGSDPKKLEESFIDLAAHSLTMTA